MKLLSTSRLMANFIANIYANLKARTAFMCLATIPIIISPNLAIAQQPSEQKAPHQASLQHAYPGGVVELLIPKTSEVLPTVMYGLAEPAIINHDQQWQVLIGISLRTLPGEYVVYVKDNDSESAAFSLPFNVQHRIKSIIELREAASFHNSEFKKLSELSFSNTEQPKLPLRLPVAGQWADRFGFLEIDTNSNSKSSSQQFQDYVSLSTTELSTVSAPSNAIVSRIVFEPSSSRSSEPLATVFLDHGRGVYSIISGITDLNVEIGNGVVAGAVIGKLPPSDQTPSTVYWRCSMNGTIINPLILTQF